MRIENVNNTNNILKKFENERRKGKRKLESCREICDQGKI